MLGKSSMLYGSYTRHLKKNKIEKLRRTERNDKGDVRFKMDG